MEGDPTYLAKVPEVLASIPDGGKMTLSEIADSLGVRISGSLVAKITNEIAWSFGALDGEYGPQGGLVAVWHGDGMVD